MIEAVGEVVVKVAEKTAETVAKAEKAAIDVSKKVEATEKVTQKELAKPDVTKRISPGRTISEVFDKGKELTNTQKENFIKKGVSEGIINKFTIKDGIYNLKTGFEKLEGTVQPESGVKYVKKTFELFGKMVEGVFPQFEAKFTAQLPKSLFLEKDIVQFKECISQLQKAIRDDPSLANQFTPRQLDQISKGKTPGGYTWHHNEEMGKMELVDSDKHSAAKHPGGRALWGGGSTCRK